MSARIARRDLDRWFSPGASYCAGWIYTVREQGTPLIKIGSSYHLRKRISVLGWQFKAAIEFVAAVAVDCCAIRVEKLIRTYLSTEHIEQEWFYCHMTEDRLAQLARAAMCELHQDDPDTIHWVPPGNKSAEFNKDKMF